MAEDTDTASATLGERILRPFQFGGYRLQQLLRGIALGVVTAAVGLVLILSPLGERFERTNGLYWLFKLPNQKLPTVIELAIKHTFGLHWRAVERTIERILGLQLLAVRESPPGVAIVAITNDTLRELGFSEEPGDWPSRAVHAGLLTRLVEQKPRGIVFDFDLRRRKPGDRTFARSIEQAKRVVLFEWLDPNQEGSTLIPPARDLAKAAKALGPFTLAKTDQPTFQFWAFKPRKGDPTGEETPTTAAIAVQLTALPVYADWLDVLKKTQAKVNSLPARSEDLTRAEDVQQLMQKLRRIFRADTSLEESVEEKIEKEKWLSNEERELLRALAALYGGPNEYYINFYGPPGTIRTINYESLVTYQVKYKNKAGGPFKENETLTFANPAGTAHLAMLDDQGTTGSLKFRMLSGSPPNNNSTINGWNSRATADALDGAMPSEDPRLADTMVFVGRLDVHYPEHPDRFYTSFTTEKGVDLSGVEIMATAYANLLTRRTLLPPDPGIAGLAVLVFGLVVGILACLLPAAWAVTAVFALDLLCWIGLEWSLRETNLWLPIAVPTFVQLPLALVIGLVGQYLLERRKEEHMRQAIRYYLPDTVVRDLAERPVDPTTLNRVVFGTCLATDMSDFIALGESKTPQELALFMNAYFDALAQCLTRHSVDVMEFRADMIMCAWIAPARSPAVCRRGTEAAVEVSDIIARFAQQHGSRHFNARVGLHDGDVYVGHTGGGGRFLYSIVGDAANTAARLESLNKHLGTHVLAAQSVVQSSDGFLLRPLGLFRLKGKTDPTFVSEILGKKDAAKPEHLDLCEQFAEGLAAFERKDWLGAASIFGAINKSFSYDGPSRFYWACCQKYALDPVSEGPVIIQMDEK